MDSTALITSFYSSFAKHDYEGMAACYHDEIEFHDPVFGTLKGIQAKAMWQMLLERSKGNLKIVFSEVKTSGSTGSARWEAFYPFSKTGRQVHNIIDATFGFKDGKIIKHHDHFNLYRWSRQAFGLAGILLGFTSFFQNKVRSTAKQSLQAYLLNYT
ncbi:MAG TPA: nuclear transport factor 2 family protein [Cyclobacteriaceae bacterium]|nr:nuclear transport factor 2 family protein [Cyclobacteriaceae bacterium]